MTTKVTEQNTECCMCGDLGFSDQLFQCKICQFRSQHRYCSNLYPKTESFGTCNWCLMNQKEESPKSSNSSSSYRNNGNFDEEGKKKKIIGFNKKGLLLKGSGGSSSLQIQIQKPMIMKKPKSPETRSPSVLVSTRKRIVTNGALEERLRRTRSENMINSSNNTIITCPPKQVFRNKVRRYKLLDEVSS